MTAFNHKINIFACNFKLRHTVERDVDGQITRETFFKMQIYAFSDCVIFFVPIEAKCGLSYLLSAIRRMHDQLIKHKCVLRGAVAAGIVKLLLDGQQRMTSLYGVVRGKAPAFIDGNANAFTGLCFHLESESFAFYAADGDPQGKADR